MKKSVWKLRIDPSENPYPVLGDVFVSILDSVVTLEVQCDNLIFAVLLRHIRIREEVEAVGTLEISFALKRNALAIDSNSNRACALTKIINHKPDCFT